MRICLLAAAVLSLACALSCEGYPGDDSPFYIPPPVKGDDGRRVFWMPKPGEKQPYEPSFSPDGKEIAVSYRDGPFGRDANLATIDLETKELTILVTGNTAKTPAWSPTGEWIAYQSQALGKRYIWLVRPDGSENHRLEIPGIIEAYTPRWSADGKKIYTQAWVEPREPLYAVSYDIDTGEMAVLRKPGELGHDNVVPARRGDKIALGLFNQAIPGRGYALALINADGTGFAPIWPENDGIGDPKDWSPDDKYVLVRFRYPNAAEDGLWTYEVATGAVRQLTMCPPHLERELLHGGSWGPNGDIIFGGYDRPITGWLFLIKAPD